jgi:serine/threonine protein kinase
MENKDRAVPDDADQTMRRDPDATFLVSSPQGAFLDSDATIVNPTTGSSASKSAAAADELQPGDVVKDRFEIVSVLGRGGMGVVYKAIDRRKVEAHDRDPNVALKALSRNWRANERMVIALQREARKAQTLAHPNIATVYDFDRDGDLVYITMEQLSGSPMDDFIREHPKGLPREKAHPIIRGICLALAYAHNKGIVHSDFKPGNVFLHNGSNPKVLDFGIARAAPIKQQSGASDLTVFDAGELGALTPSYAAPEMFQGAPPHPADDVYALAVTTYQLLSGRHPFDNLPAPQARAAGRKPDAIKGLRRREWRAIRQGLEFERSQRLGHAEEFLRVFEGPKRARMAIAASTVLALILTGYFSFDQLQEAARIAPDVPFDTLPAQTQAAFRQHMDDGNMAWKFNEASSAISSWQEAYTLHPRNPEATKLLVSGYQSLADRVIANNDHEGLISVRENLQDLMQLDGFLGRHPDLRKIQQELESQR